MNETSQWIWSLLIVCLFAWQMVRVNGAIVPPPWSDPNKNPCASMPGGWQLLYWAPLKQCFKIFTVRAASPSGMSISWLLISQFIVFADWISVSRHNGTDAIRKQYKIKWHGSRVPLPAEHSITSAHDQFDAVLSAVRTGSMRNWSVFCTRRWFEEQRKYVSKITTSTTRCKKQKMHSIYTYLSFIHSRQGVCKTPLTCFSGMARWPQDSKCYTLHTRGPCSKGKLMVMGKNKLAECKVKAICNIGRTGVCCSIQ